MKTAPARDGDQEVDRNARSCRLAGGRAGPCARQPTCPGRVEEGQVGRGVVEERRQGPRQPRSSARAAAPARAARPAAPRAGAQDRQGRDDGHEDARRRGSATSWIGNQPNSLARRSVLAGGHQAHAMPISDQDAHPLIQSARAPRDAPRTFAHRLGEPAAEQTTPPIRPSSQTKLGRRCSEPPGCAARSAGRPVSRAEGACGRRRRTRASTDPAVEEHRRQERLVQKKGTPCRKPRKSGGSPSGVSEPPTLATRKMKKTDDVRAMRRRRWRAAAAGSGASRPRSSRSTRRAGPDQQHGHVHRGRALRGAAT